MPTLCAVLDIGHQRQAGRPVISLLRLRARAFRSCETLLGARVSNVPILLKSCVNTLDSVYTERFQAIDEILGHACMVHNPGTIILSGFQ